MPETGQAWSDQEIRIALESYFAMLLLDLSGAAYVKRRFAEKCGRLLPVRSRKSIEYKWCNISAVLEEAQLPWIPGFKPMHNYQERLADMVARWLLDHPVLRSVLHGAREA